ncbi:MAG TPA: helix-turn-helix transcriptional regulator [Kofleriaceae bacterium]|nr:helix-turn-helix transcriptional regulator [Kofleriaceae bacterium]
MLGMIQGSSAAPITFCVISCSEPTTQLTAGWLSIDGSIDAMYKRAQIALLSAAPSDGACEIRHELVDGYNELSVVSFEVQGMRVCAGTALREGEPRDPVGLDRLRDVAQVGARVAALRAQCFEYERRDLVLRALRNMNDACCVIDLDARRVSWLYDLREDQLCTQDVLRDERSFVDLAEQFHLATTLDQPAPHATVGRTAIVRSAELGRPSAFDEAPSLAISLSYFDGKTTKLSSRERQIAQLLANGYSTVNAAAILSLSENTIRTYVRRLYRKLEITNRSDLTRKCSELCL